MIEMIVADYNSKPAQGLLFEFKRNAIYRVRVEGFLIYKSWYKRVLVHYNLWDSLENDLDLI